ncbi:MAG: hypothetical protein PVI21_01010 [Candidatus Woesebacteria bacterium]|jgi:hypothetical protein
MAQQKFDELFRGYPDNSSTLALRDRVEVAITNSICSMERARQELEQTGPDTQDKLQSIVTDIDVIAVWTETGAPALVETDLRRIRKPFYDALHTYNIARMRGKRGATKEDHEAFKQATIATLDNLLAWLRSIQPDA